jgi:hypothetical protein
VGTDAAIKIPGIRHVPFGALRLIYTTLPCMQEWVVGVFAALSSTPIPVPATKPRRVARQTTVLVNEQRPVPVLTEFFAMLLGECPVFHHPSKVGPALR